MTKKNSKKKKEIKFDNLKIDLDLSPDTSREIYAFIIGLLSLFSLLSMVGWLGPAGDITKTIFLLAIGLPAYLLPVIFAYFALHLILPAKINLQTRQTVSLILFLLILSSSFCLSFPHAPAAAGGYLGLWVNSIILGIIGRYGTVILYSFLLIISFLLFFNTSFSSLINQYQNLLRYFRFRSPKISRSTEKITINSYRDVIPVSHDENANPENKTDLETKHSSDKPIVVKDKPTVNSISESSSDTAKPSSIISTSPNNDIDWQLPPLSLLEETKMVIHSGNIDQNLKIIENTFAEFGIDVEMKDVNIGPTVTQYTFKPANGVKLSKITSLQNDLSLALAAHPIRVEAPIPGKSLVGIEIPNKKPAPVRLKPILESPNYTEQKFSVPVPLGRDISGIPTIDDLTKMPHLLIAGSTGSGKSVFINTFLSTLLCSFTPEQIKFILVDPKKVELTPYNNLPHLLTPVVTEPKNALNALKWALAEMNDRYQILSDNKARNIAGYNAKHPDQKMPYIVVVIDELADLMMTAGNDIETAICRLAQMARATGIHLVVATQRPSVDVITGLIKANIATRIAFAVASQIDSRTILDMSGAEKLLGKGDMLYISRETGKPRRIQGVFVSDQEIESITQFWKNEGPEPEYFTNITSGHTDKENTNTNNLFDDVDDDLINEVLELVISNQQASASFLQRKLKIGYARAARLIDILEQKNVISPQEGNKPRQVLIKSLDEL